MQVRGQARGTALATPPPGRLFRSTPATAPQDARARSGERSCGRGPHLKDPHERHEVRCRHRVSPVGRPVRVREQGKRGRQEAHQGDREARQGVSLGRVGSGGCLYWHRREGRRCRVQSRRTRSQHRDRGRHLWCDGPQHRVGDHEGLARRGPERERQGRRHPRRCREGGRLDRADEEGRSGPPGRVRRPPRHRAVGGGHGVQRRDGCSQIREGRVLRHGCGQGAQRPDRPGRSRVGPALRGPRGRP